MYKVTLDIDGMMCGMCEAHINDAIRKSFDVKKVTSSHKKGVTEVIAQQQPDEDKLKAVIAETGYELKGVKTEPYEKKGFFSRK